MDPVSQGFLGALAAQTVLGPRAPRRVMMAGLAGGLLPDADVALESFADPALPWELHRHFTHAFVMAPVMGALAALPLLLFPAFRRIRGTVVLAAIVGAITHAPLDLCTSYGTKVWWPFSLENATLDLFPIIDPVFTLVLLACVLLAAFRRTRAPALAGAVFVGLYTALAFVQRDAALEAQQQLIAARGEAAVRARVMPLPASLLAWRSLYEVDDVMVADILRPAPFGDTRLVVGGRLPLVEEAEIVAKASDPQRVAYVYRRFARFADGWTAWMPGEPRRVGDMRFSLDAGFEPPWALALGEGPDEPAVSWSMGAFGERDTGGLLRVILGTSPALGPLEPTR